MISIEKMIALIEKHRIESFNYPHGIICSENTMNLLKEKFGSISGNKVKSIVDLYGIPVCVEKYFMENKLWILNKELWEIYLKEGLVGLIKYMKAKRNKKENRNAR